jgi:hypothetical protein
VRGGEQLVADAIERGRRPTAWVPGAEEAIGADDREPHRVLVEPGDPPADRSL